MMALPRRIHDQSETEPPRRVTWCSEGLKRCNGRTRQLAQRVDLAAATGFNIKVLGTAIDRQESQGGLCQKKRPVSGAGAAHGRDVEMQHRECRQGGQFVWELQICITADRKWAMVMPSSAVFWRPFRKANETTNKIWDAYRHFGAHPSPDPSLWPLSSSTIACATSKAVYVQQNKTFGPSRLLKCLCEYIVALR